MCITAQDFYVQEFEEGEQAFDRSIVLAGGITGASIMALVFIPAAYRLLRRWVAVRPEQLGTVPASLEVALA